MAIAPSWRDNVPFAHRMQLVQNIAKAHLHAFPESSTSEAQTEGRKCENEAFQTCQTREQYDQRCQSIIKSYHDLIGFNEAGESEGTGSQAEVEFPVELASKQRTKVGPYDQCIHLYTGLFSHVYLTQSLSPPTTLLAIKSTSPASEEPPHDSKREARILSTLSHPNVIPLLDSVSVPNEGAFLLVFPYRRINLEDALASWPSLQSEEDVTNSQRSILRNLFSGLASVHSCGILHRDIKTSNILLSCMPMAVDRGTCVAQIADFGVAWSVNEPSSLSAEPPTRKITDVGTTCYRAPELLFGCRLYGESVDLWAAGCVAAEVLAHPRLQGSSVEERSSSEGSPKRDAAYWTLFDPGPLGSDLALVKSIFSTLGTPHAASWPETSQPEVLPDWGKMTFVEFPAKSWAPTSEGDGLLPGVRSAEEIELVQGLVKYHMAGRPSAQDVLQLPYFHPPA